MQPENKTKNIIKNAFTIIGSNRVNSDLSLWMFYDLEVPAILLDKSDKTIDASDKLNS